MSTSDQAVTMTEIRPDIMQVNFSELERQIIRPTVKTLTTKKHYTWDIKVSVGRQKVSKAVVGVRLKCYVQMTHPYRPISHSLVSNDWEVRQIMWKWIWLSANIRNEEISELPYVSSLGRGVLWIKPPTHPQKWSVGTWMCRLELWCCCHLPFQY